MSARVTREAVAGGAVATQSLKAKAAKGVKTETAKGAKARAAKGAKAGATKGAKAKVKSGLTKSMRETLEAVARSEIFGSEACWISTNAKKLVELGLLEKSHEVLPVTEDRRVKPYCAYRLTPEGISVLGTFAQSLQDRLLMDEKDAQLHKRLQEVAPGISSFIRKVPKWGGGTSFATELRTRHSLELYNPRLILAGPFMRALHLQILDQDLEKAEALVARLKEMKEEISLILEDRDRLEREAKDSGDELMVRALGATVGTWPKVNGNWGDGRWSG
jgi:hypothetical protein